MTMGLLDRLAIFLSFRCLFSSFAVVVFLWVSAFRFGLNLSLIDPVFLLSLTPQHPLSYLGHIGTDRIIAFTTHHTFCIVTPFSHCT